MRTRRRPVRLRRSCSRLLVEQLEDRSLPSGGYSFAPVALLGQPTPGPEGGQFFFDFETGGLNNKGQVVFTADLSLSGAGVGEGIFLGDKGGLSQIIRAGETAPGGGTFGGFGSFSPDTINGSGDVAFGFGLDPFTLPIGNNAGVYRYDHSSGTVTAVVVPGVTPTPEGDTFQGTMFHPSLSNRGDLVFPGIVPATIGPGASGGLGVGIFLANKHGVLTTIVRPGDAAPGGNTFDFAENPAINNRGDIAFGAHITADPCLDLGQTFPIFIFCAESVYLRDGQTGVIQSIAHQGAAIPDAAGGGAFDYAYAPVLNSRGQILFDAGLQGTTTPSGVDSQALFLYSDGGLIPIVRQGDAMPGGGQLVSASFNPGNYDLNNEGDVAFNALLDT
ncbi:MAG TPA: choice-of-anchor tandem repeat NxxGxxAF-containing protein, partial [Gemmataceae bacterium]|nr:choice-of-anchor tandem repeat NxxGxxAF-containing protein [Gemmataceae bacterium]